MALSRFATDRILSRGHQVWVTLDVNLSSSGKRIAAKKLEVSLIDSAEDDILIVRFSPMNFGKLCEAAEDEVAECQAEGRRAIYSISTFGMNRNVKESEDDVIKEICAKAGAGGKTIWLTSSSKLADANFEVELAEPPPHHYNIILGGELIPADVERLVNILEPGRRRNPAWRR